MKTLALLLTILLVPFLLRAQIVHIPDANFKAALVGNSSINTNGDDEIQVSEAEAYTGGIYVDNQGIADMTGLEAFTLLQYLDCSDNQLTSLDVSANTALTILWCESNQLASLDVSANTALEQLNCSSNQLTSLNVSGNTAIQTLLCGRNQLTNLDLSANTALTSLSCYSNQLTGLDVSSNTALTRLDCWSNQLHSLNVRNGNNASIINFNAALNPALSCITVSDVAYAEANWTNIDEGVIFSEGGCNVYIPDANFKAALLADDAINTIDDSEIQYREAETYSGSIYVPNLSIADMTGLEAFKSVTGLDCSANNLSQLVVRQNARIVSIDCGNNELGSLDVSLNPALETLNCASNQLKGLELSNTNNLRQLDCQSNQLEILDLSDNVKLTELYCQSNQLRSLDVKNGNNEQITAFDARNNPSLSCIAVDDEAYSAANWPNVDAEGLFNEEGCAVVYIPDAGFKAALLANTGINTNWDTEIQVSEAKAYTGDIQVPSTGISDMTGLEAFTKLTTLDCSGNQLSELDMKANELLIQLNCSNNQLGRLALRSNQLLEQLDCSNNQLSRLALRSNPLLEQLDCSNNQLELLDLRMNSALKEMLCQSNQLHSLDLRNGANEAITAFDATVNPTLICITVDDADYAESNWSGIDDGTVFSEDGCNVHIPDAIFKAALVGNGEINTNGDGEIQVSEAEAYDGTIDVDDQGIADMTGLEAFVNLTRLECSYNQLTSLDVSANTALESLRCDGNELTSLVIGANTALTYLDCSGNQLTSLDVSANTALRHLYCDSNQLASLDVSANTALATLWCYSNQLTGLDVSANTALTYLYCRSNQLTSLDVSANTLLEWLICPSNQLTNLDLSANTALTYLDCEYNQLTSLDVSENALLEQLDCERNQLTSLDVSANALLEQLICDNNQLTSLDLVGNKILELLYCGSNQLTSLDVSANVTLELLYCYSNQLTSLDISTNTALTELSCGENQLTSLDVSANTTLRHLDCSSNQLTTLDVSANTELTTFRCYSNQLHSLNVRNGNNASIINFNAALNPALSCITVSDVAYAEANWTNIDEGVIFSEGGCNVYIPDANFKAALLADDAINTIDDSEIQYREAETYSGSIYVPNLSIADMTGLEAFKSVTGLDCSANNLSQLVVRQNARIVSIDCGNNELGSLDVSLNPALETLNCASNQLKGLELSNTNNLRQLDCQSNQLEILDLSDNVKLTELYCQSNQLRSLDVKNGNNEQITAFDARNNPSLSCIAVDDEAYSAANWPNVDAEGLFNEEGCAVVYIPDAGFKAALLANTSINTNSDAEIQYSEAAVFTGMMDVHALEISDMTGLEAFTGLSGLDCSSNLLNELDVASNELLTQLNCSNNQLSRLALRSNPLLEQLDCSNNQLGLLDLRMNSALKDVLCQSNQLHSLNLRNGANEAITAFDATDNAPLACISVDDADYATANWTMIDAGTVFSEGGCNVNIPDANFKATVVSNGEINTNGDDEIQVSEAEAYDGTIDVDDQGIADMTGLEAFVNLTRLECSYNQLTSLDVSANTALRSLECYSNQLTGLDVSANTALTYLDCSGNQLTSLDVSANTALTYLDCWNTKLTDLDVSANTALTTLDCQYNQLTSLDVSANTLLERLYCGSNKLTSLDLSANTALRSLECYSNQLTGLDLSANTKLNNLSCGSNKLTSLDLSANTALRSLECYSNQLTGLDLSANTALRSLECYSNQLTGLDVSANTALESLRCDVNQLTSLDVSANTLLESLYCSENQLTSLDVSANTLLESLYCSENQLTGLDVSANTALGSLECYSNQLTGLDVSANTLLESLYCSENQLTSLDVSANTALEELRCSSNQLTSLDVSANTVLNHLSCRSNQLTGLDVSANTMINELFCSSNQLTALNLRNGNNHWITAFDATGNPSLACIAVSDLAFAEANWTNIDEGMIFSEGGCNVYIPDANFKAALLADDAINTNDDPEIQYGEAEAYTGTIEVANLGISDMTGLEAFKSVTGLDCSDNNLSQLIVRQNASLVFINCGNNELGSLDVSLNPALETLNCASNQLKGLSLGTNNNLRQLDCQSNQLEQLDLFGNMVLTELYCQSNQLKQLDLSNNAVLRELYCQSNQLVILDVKNGNNEQITAFDARNNPSLVCIAVDDPAYSTANWPNVDVQGLFNEIDCAVVYIPDAGFKAALLANTGINTNGDTEIQLSEAKAYTGNIQVPSTGISDMTGLEAFTKLTALDCSGNQLGELDVKANELLTQLNCSNNQLSRLALRSNPLLEQLDCSNNQLELLDLRMNSALKDVLCQSNQLHSLDLRNGANEAITAFDATVNPPLICITVDDADYAESNWSGIDDGTVFSEDGCNVYIPDASFKAALVGNGGINTNGDGEIQVGEAEAHNGWIIVDNHGIADMTGLEAFTALYVLDCQRNRLTSLDVSANTLLERLYCTENQLTGLDVSANTLLERLLCYRNQLTSLDVSANTALTALSCGSNQLTSLDVSANTLLERLYCTENQLTGLDVSANTALTYLSCSNNQLTTLDLSANTLLESLYCSENQLTSLNVRNGNNSSITNFSASQNPALSCITVSDVAFAEANWTSIDQGVIFSEGGCNVYIPDANFKAALLADAAINTNNDSEIQYGEAEAYTGSIEVENLAIADMTGLEAFKSITGLNCADNELTQLVLRYHTALESIDCSGNQLGALDMKANEALKSLNCASNQLTSLDVRNGHNTQITEFDATNNSSLNCISVDDANYSTENWTNIDSHTSFNGDCYFIADFEADVTSGVTPLDVQFVDRSDQSASSWLWYFGDGSSSSQQSPKHTYTTAGKYNVLLIIGDGIKTNRVRKVDLVEVLAVTALKAEDQEKSPLVYPNPATNLLILQFEPGMRSVRMLNLNGQTVYEKHGIDKLAGRLEIDTSTYPPGEYIIRFEGKGKTTARKVLISR